MSLDNKISNIIGVRLPEWVLQQLTTRSEQGSKSSKDNSNLIYTGNKSCWIRLVSSIDINDTDILNNFKMSGADLVTSLPDGTGGRRDTLGDASGLSQQFILYGGTSIYLNNSYKQRAGLGRGGSYSPLGDDEVKKYGYRPMPGITNVSIETQGRLGSVRAATVNFKCWNKSQLDIIDALYFRLGYSMFLEWGHTYFYPSTDIKIDDKTNLTPDQLASTELLFSLDPFKQNLTKEDILLHITKNSRRSEGNYDAMLGIVTQFNFSYNQEGGYDCMIKIISLGYLADGIKINNISGLPQLLNQKIIQYNKLIEAINTKDSNGLPEPSDTLDKQDTLAAVETGEGIPNYPSSVKYQFIQRRQETVTQEQLGIYANSEIEKGAFGEVLFIRKLNGFFPFNLDRYGNNINLKLNSEKFNEIVSGVQFGDINTWKVNLIESSATSLKQEYFEFEKSYKGLTPELDYKIKIFFEKYAKINTNLDPSSIENYSDIQNQLQTEKLAFNQSSDITFPATTIELVESDNGVRPTFINLTDREYFYTVATNVTGLLPEQFFSNTFQLSNNIEPATIFKPKIERIVSRFPSNTQNIVTWNFRVSTILSVKKYGVKIRIKNLIDNSTSTLVNREFTTNLIYTYNVGFEFNDTDLIKLFNTNITNFEQPPNFLSEQKLRDQDAQIATLLQEQQAGKSATPDQSESTKLTVSALEALLRTIQLESLSRAIQDNNKQLDVGTKVNPIPLANNKEFIKALLSVGVFTDILDDLLENRIPDAEYESLTDSKARLKLGAKYGFATNLMAGKASTFDFSPVNYKELLTSYVLPYEINQTLADGTDLNHPVYISFGTLLMLLNHSCTLYDEKNPGVQTPLVYLDFNTQANYCLSNTQQLSTNPMSVLIAMEGEDSAYRKIFSEDVLVTGKNEIRNPDTVNNTNETIPLFSLTKESNISANLPPYRYGVKVINTKESTNTDESYISYRGKIMNVLLNIEHIIDKVKITSTNDEQNKVFLKPFIDNILSDINKYLGNFNILRLSYNDAGNTMQIVDDQILPVTKGEEALKRYDEPSNVGAELPLVGKNSIAKNLEVKTEISSKLSNMIAISANSQNNQSILSTNGDYFGKLNRGYIDRYIPERKEYTIDGKDSQLNGKIRAAIQFNAAIRSYYNSLKPSEDQVSFVTNYFIDRMTRLKGKTPATAAAAVIPVSINFTTDGISGLGMGQSFTVSKEVLPYNYFKKIGNYDRNIGFVVVGLTHTIENNQWNTSVRSNMIFIKNQEDYVAEKVATKNLGEIQKTGVTPRNPITPNAIALITELKSLGYQEKFKNGEGQIANWADITKEMSDLAIRLFRSIKNSSDRELNSLNIEVTAGNDDYHQYYAQNSYHVYGKGLDFTISNYTIEKYNKIEKLFNDIVKRYGPRGANIDNEYERLSDKATGKHIHINIV